MKISITLYGNTTSYETDRDDQDISEMASILKGLMISVGFHPHSVDEYFLDTGGEWFPDLEEKTDDCLSEALSLAQLDEISMKEESKLPKTKMDTLVDGVKEAFDQ